MHRFVRGTYYDKLVEDENSRATMLRDINENPIWQLFIPRNKYLIRFIDAYCQNHAVLEIGCGNSRTVANIFNPNKHYYQYVGSDISFKRLLVAKRAIPEGDFLQASAMNLPFQDNIFQAIISFGILHHLSKSDMCIESCLKKTKENGFFCFHEPILKPKVLGNRDTFLKKIFTTYEHSQHDKDLDLSSALKILLDNKFKIISYKKMNSIFKTLMEAALIKFSSKRFYMNKSIVKIVLILDSIFISTICHLWKGLGPHGAIIVAKKTS